MNQKTIVECPHENCAIEITIRNKLIPYNPIRTMVDEYLNDFNKESSNKKIEIDVHPNINENTNDSIDDLLNNEFKYTDSESNQEANNNTNDPIPTPPNPTIAPDENSNTDSNNRIVSASENNGMNRIPTTYNMMQSQQMRYVNRPNINRMHFQQHQVGYLGQPLNRHMIQQPQYLIGAPLNYFQQQWPQQQQPIQRFPLHHHTYLQQQQQHFQNRSPININNHVEIQTTRETKSRR